MRKVVAIMLTLLWMGFIFYNSSKNADKSNKASYSILNLIQNFHNNPVEESHRKFRDGASKDKSQENLKEYKINEKQRGNGNYIEIKEKEVDIKKQKFNVLIRKNAHAFEFFVLAILICNVLCKYKISLNQGIIYVMFICILYAVLDEFHQCFVPGRSSSVKDVLIDFVGSIFGILIYILVNKIYCKIYKNFK
ncbi:VanZ family protein [Clostridium rectalis]|uniref:VanZ family protein n=1 Tax=Clostridium rectalis TaxID=2040295 RepID=UPI000F6382EA|nr:VanZ family protein [Clostridium rectalis]